MEIYEYKLVELNLINLIKNIKILSLIKTHRVLE